MPIAHGRRNNIVVETGEYLGPRRAASRALEFESLINFTIRASRQANPRNLSFFLVQKPSLFVTTEYTNLSVLLCSLTRFWYEPLNGPASAASKTGRPATT